MTRNASLCFLHADRFFSEILTNPALDLRLLPTLTFSISILIAFATGSSWGTMAIM